jgi:hypothetical protein
MKSRTKPLKMDINFMVDRIVGGVLVKDALAKLRTNEPDFSDQDARDVWISFLKNLVLGIWHSNCILPLHSEKTNPAIKDANCLDVMKESIKQMERELNIANAHFLDSQIKNCFGKSEDWGKVNLELSLAFDNAKATIDNFNKYLKMATANAQNPYYRIIGPLWRLSKLLSKDERTRKRIAVEMCSVIYESFDYYKSEDQVKKVLARYLKDKPLKK